MPKDIFAKYKARNKYQINVIIGEANNCNLPTRRAEFLFFLRPIIALANHILLAVSFGECNTVVQMGG